MRIIALSGEMYTGKSTFAEPLIQRGWLEGSFAANLKEMCKSVFNLTDYFVNDPEGKRKILSYPRCITPKTLAQIIGWMDKTHKASDETREITDIRTSITTLQRLTGEYPKFYTTRELLQYVGTDICRRLVPEYHVDVLRLDLERIQGNWIIADARFPNERTMLREEFGAKLIRIKRPGYTPEHLLNRLQPKDIIKTVHISENSLGEDLEYNTIIINDGNIEELKEKALTFL